MNWNGWAIRRRACANEQFSRPPKASSIVLYDPYSDHSNGNIISAQNRTCAGQGKGRLATRCRHSAVVPRLEFGLRRDARHARCGHPVAHVSGCPAFANRWHCRVSRAELMTGVGGACTHQQTLRGSFSAESKSAFETNIYSNFKMEKSK